MICKLGEGQINFHFAFLAMKCGCIYDKIFLGRKVSAVFLKGGGQGYFPIPGIRLSTSMLFLCDR